MVYKKLAYVLILCIGMSFPCVASGHEYDREEWTDAFEVLDYIVSPVSFAVENLVLKPLHALLSIGPLEKVFGHEESEEEEVKGCEMECCQGSGQESPCGQESPHCQEHSAHSDTDVSEVRDR